MPLNRKVQIWLEEPAFLDLKLAAAKSAVPMGRLVSRLILGHRDELMETHREVAALTQVRRTGGF